MKSTRQDVTPLLMLLPPREQNAAFTLMQFHADVGWHSFAFHPLATDRHCLKDLMGWCPATQSYEFISHDDIDENPEGYAP